MDTFDRRAQPRLIARYDKKPSYCRLNVLEKTINDLLNVANSPRSKP
jgi:hypothetical protein